MEHEAADMRKYQWDLMRFSAGAVSEVKDKVKGLYIHCLHLVAASMTTYLLSAAVVLILVKSLDNFCQGLSWHLCLRVLSLHSFLSVTSLYTLPELESGLTI